jgi:GTP-binding protein HflX
MLEKKRTSIRKSRFSRLNYTTSRRRKLTEYLDELEFLAFTAGATVEKRLLKNYLNQILELL